MARFLFSLPGLQVDGHLEHHLGYASCVAKRIADEHGIPTTDGTVAANVDAINAQDPDVFWSIGHGSPELHTAECTEDFIRTENYLPPLNLELFGGRVVHLLSCYCGLKLVPDLVSKGGAEAAIGYTEPFYLGVRETPTTPEPEYCADPIPESDYYTFNDCDLEIQRALWDGKSVGEAVAASQAEHEKQIERYETGDRSDWPIAEEAAVWLNNNMVSQVLYPGGPSPVRAGLGLVEKMFTLSGVFFIVSMVYRKATTGKWALPF